MSTGVPSPSGCSTTARGSSATTWSTRGGTSTTGTSRPTARTPPSSGSSPRPWSGPPPTRTAGWCCGARPRGRRPDPRRLPGPRLRRRRPHAARGHGGPGQPVPEDPRGRLPGRGRLLPDDLPARPEVRAHPGLPVRGVLRRGGRGPHLRPAAPAVPDAEGHRGEHAFVDLAGGYALRHARRPARPTHGAGDRAGPLRCSAGSPAGPDDREADPMQRTGLPPNKTATYVMRRWKTVYVSVPKAACTSLKWLVADLQEEDPEHFYETAERGDLPHDDHPPPLPVAAHADAARARRRGARRDHPGERLVRFAVVRHPAARFWSGWQSKFLLHEPHFFKRYPEAHLAAAPGVHDRRGRGLPHLRAQPARPTPRRRSSTTGTSAPRPGCCKTTGCPTAASTRPPSSAS